MITIDRHSIGNFKRCKGSSLEIYQMAPPMRLCDISNMPIQSAKDALKAAVPARARMMHDLLMTLKDDFAPGYRAEHDKDFSNNEWARVAGVNTSFFTALATGTDSGGAKIAALLEVVGVTEAEFYAMLDKKEDNVRLLRAARKLSPADRLKIIGLAESLAEKEKKVG